LCGEDVWKLCGEDVWKLCGEDVWKFLEAPTKLLLSLFRF
jgi:hypothetical protein